MNPRPRLRSDIVIVEQTFQGERSYVFKDPAAQKYYRFKPLEALIIQQFSGEVTCAEIAAAFTEQGLQLSAASVTGFARRLDQMGLFERSLSEKSVMLLERLRTERRRRLKGRAYEGTIFRMRWSVGNPNKFFERWLPSLRFCFTPTFVVISVAIFALYGLVLVTQWDALFGGLGALINPATITVGKIATIYLTMSVIVALHELGHGFTCKYFGGDVHEIGAMLLYFEPAFFCNVNDAWTFPELRHRLWVTAAGSWVQMLLAALAALLWLLVEPGTVVGNIAVTGVVLGGGIAVLANANPLIPLDGYYALTDYLEVPNLRHRAFAHLNWWIKRYVLRLAIPEPAVDDRERRILLRYAVLSTLYIGFLFSFLAMKLFGFLSRTMGAVGVVALAIAIAALLRGWVVQWAHTVVMAVRQHRAAWKERRLGTIAGAVALGVVVLSVVVPWPIVVLGSFQVEPERSYALAAPDSAVVARVYAPEGTLVSAGGPLVRLRSFALESEQIALHRAVDSLSAEVRGALADHQAGALRELQTRRTEQQARLDAITARLDALVLRAPVTGVVVTPRIEERIGARVQAGDVVVRFQQADSLRVRIRLQRAGARYVQAGQRVRLLSEMDRSTSVRTVVAEVAAGADSTGAVDAYVVLPGEVEVLHPWATGEAKVTVRTSNVLGAIWWTVRKHLRNDLLL